MFNFLRKFSNSSKQSFFEESLEESFGKPKLDSEFRQNVKKRILNQIAAETQDVHAAKILDKKLTGEKIQPSTAVDFLAAIAEAFLNLPKVLPGASWRESIRENFRNRKSSQCSVIFRQVTAFAMLFIVIGGIALTSFISQTQAAVAQLFVESGIVKIKTAESDIFEDVQNVAAIRLGDTIRVEQDSAAELTFFDESEMWLTEGTEIAIVEFNPNFISREKSAVRVAVIAGSVETTVSKETGAFEIETLAGSVEAQNAKFSVAVNSQTGSTKIQTSEDVVAVKSSVGSEIVVLVAGEEVIFEDPDFVEILSAEIDPLSIEQIATNIDFIKIRGFDALIAAQKNKIEISGKIRAVAQEKLELLIADLGLQVIEANRSAVLEIFIRKNYPVVLAREKALASLNQFVKVEQILNYYFVAPQFLRGVPEFEILASSHFTPSGELRNLFTVLRARQLAHTEIYDTIDELALELTIELVNNLRSGNFTEQLIQILQQMEDQSIFIPTLEKLESIVPSIVRGLVSDKISQLKELVREYVEG